MVRPRRRARFDRRSARAQVQGQAAFRDRAHTLGCLGGDDGAESRAHLPYIAAPMSCSGWEIRSVWVPRVMVTSPAASRALPTSVGSFARSDHWNTGATVVVDMETPYTSSEPIRHHFRTNAEQATDGLHPVDLPSERNRLTGRRSRRSRSATRFVLSRRLLSGHDWCHRRCFQDSARWYDCPEPQRL